MYACFYISEILMQESFEIFHQKIVVNYKIICKNLDYNNEYM
jgi:hypothetical protein